MMDGTNYFPEFHLPAIMFGCPDYLIRYLEMEMFTVHPPGRRDVNPFHFPVITQFIFAMQKDNED